MRTTTKAFGLLLALAVCGAQAAGPLKAVGFESAKGTCSAWWQFDEKSPLPSYFARAAKQGAQIEVGFSGVEWNGDVQTPGKAGVSRVRAVERADGGKRIAIFQIKPSAPVSGELKKALDKGRFSLSWSCAEGAAKWNWPKADAAPKPEAKPEPAPKSGPAPKPEAAGDTSLDDFFAEVSGDAAKGVKGFVLQGARRLVVSVPKSLLYMKPDKSSSIVRELAVGDTLFSGSLQNGWYAVRTSGRDAYVSAAVVKRLEDVTSADEAQLRKLVHRQISRMQEPDGGVSLHEKEIGGTREVTVGSAPAPGDTAALAPSRAPKQFYRYSSFGRRDPFIPFEEPEVDGLSIDEVQLVGIIWDSETPLAIFEDVRLKGISYTLREGDEVVNGNVYKISKTEVVFLLTEFGVSRKYTMVLPRIIE